MILTFWTFVCNSISAIYVTVLTLISDQFSGSASNMQIKQCLVVIAVACATYVLLQCLEGEQFDGSSLRGKNVLIVGASSGIGEQTAYWYARYGANVFISARREDRLKQVVTECKTRAPPGDSRITYLVADMEKRESRNYVIQSALEFFAGDLDQLVLCHALHSPVYTWNGSDVDMTVLKSLFEVNFVSFVELTALALPSLRRTGGSVGVVSSITARLPLPFLLEYEATKAALDGFFSGLRFEFKATKQNVSFTICIIGLIDTDAGRIVMDKASKKTSLPLEFLLELLGPANAETTAHAIVSATTRRKGELYHPTHQFPWLIAVIRSISPQIFEIFDFRYKPE